jgi:hypothetical protein
MISLFKTRELFYHSFKAYSFSIMRLFGRIHAAVSGGGIRESILYVLSVVEIRAVRVEE